MDLSKWKRRRFVPTWGGNDQEPEPCRVVFLPPSVGWMARWRELAMKSPNLDPERVSEEGYLDGISEWTESIQGFRDELLQDLILGIEDLTLDGKAVSLQDGLAFILDNEGLREEIFLAIIAEGTMGEDQGKG